MNEVRDFGRIGKSALVLLSGIQERMKETTRTKYIDNSICRKSQCPIYKAKTEFPNKYIEESKYKCEDFCQAAVKERVVTKYINESNYYKLSEYPRDIRLSKSQIKQFLAFHILPIDKRGVLKNIGEKRLANILNCTVETVRNNNKRLVDLGLILLSNSGKSSFNVIVKDYDKYHLPSHQGGTGYLYLTKELFGEILKIDNVNALRVSLRMILKEDNVVAEERIDVLKSSFTNKEVFNILPKYTHYRGYLELISAKLSGLFNTELQQKEIKFHLPKELEVEELMSQKLELYRAKIENCITNARLVLKEKDIVDFIQMSIQYGLDAVLMSIEILARDYIYKNTKIKNLGGLVRSIVESLISTKIA